MSLSDGHTNPLCMVKLNGCPAYPQLKEKTISTLDVALQYGDAEHRTTIKPAF